MRQQISRMKSQLILKVIPNQKKIVWRWSVFRLIELMMTPRLNKQHQWLPSCFDVNWQVFNLSNLMHDLNGGSSRMKTFPFQRLSTYSPPPHFFYTFCFIFSSLFFTYCFERCPLVHLDWKILNQARCRKCWKVKMICT